jgi:lipid kinase YegS
MTDRGAALLVLHGKAASRDDLRQAVRAARDDGFRIDVRVTWEPGDAARFAEEGTRAGHELVLAGGGDGTVNEVVAGMMRGAADAAASPSLGVIPLGTANDLAHACEIPLDPRAALRLALSRPSTIVDVGQANGRPFINVATGGFGTQVTVATPPELKRVLGGAAYFLTGLTHFTSIQPEHGRFTGPDFAWEGAFLVLAVGNGRQAGGGRMLCPEAMLDDGLVDVRLLPLVPKEDVPDALRALLHEGLAGLRVVGARLPWLEIETEERLQINLDGEPMEGTRFRFEALPRRLPKRTPDGCPLVR